MGTRSEYRNLIAKRTGIEQEVLEGKDPLHCSIANRMSWVSQRRTARVEDLAYCLTGIFGVNMPLIYGEKHKAFFRLQTEIMKVSEDRSLFAWKTPDSTNGNVRCGLLAESPANFVGSRNVVPCVPYHTHNRPSQPPFSMTNRGVYIYLPFIRVESRQYGVHELFFVTIDCQDTTDRKGPLGVFLVRNEGDASRRFFPHRLEPAGMITGSFGPIDQNMIYVTQTDGTRMQPQRAFGACIPEMPAKFAKQGAILQLLADPDQKSFSFHIPEFGEDIAR